MEDNLEENVDRIKRELDSHVAQAKFFQQDMLSNLASVKEGYMFSALDNILKRLSAIEEQLQEKDEENEDGD